MSHYRNRRVKSEHSQIVIHFDTLISLHFILDFE